MKIPTPEQVDAEVVHSDAVADERRFDTDSMRLCVCGRVFTPYRSFQRYCSDACRVKANKARPSKYKRRPTVKIRCQECGQEFETNDGKRRYCSRACYVAFQLKRHVPSETRVCMRCGKRFTTTHWLKRYCSESCRLEVKYEGPKNAG